MTEIILCESCKFNWKNYYCSLWNTVIDPLNRPQEGCPEGHREQQLANAIKSRPTTLAALIRNPGGN